MRARKERRVRARAACRYMVLGGEVLQAMGLGRRFFHLSWMVSRG